MSELLIIDKADLVAVADSIRAKTGKADLMYVSQMSDEIAEISGIPEDSMEGLENGYDVMFYDENNYALAMYSIKEGHSINPPVYNCKNWQTDAGASVAFPYTPSGDVIFYANNDTYASQLYKFYGVDSVVYTYLFIGASDTTCELSFATEIRFNNGSLQKKGFYTASASTKLTDYSIENVIGVVMSSIAKSSLKWFATSKGYYSCNGTHHYTNFDNDATNITNKYRLDE